MQVRYYPDTDTMAIDLRPWPGGKGDAAGYDAGPDLVIHDGPDGAPWLWEIEHASQHPEHIAAGLAAMQRRMVHGTLRDAVAELRAVRWKKFHDLLQELKNLRGDTNDEIIISDPEIQGGEPVFRGTRISVHRIAELLAQGTPEAELREDYPRLTTEMISLARLFAAEAARQSRLVAEADSGDAGCRMTDEEIIQKAIEIIERDVVGEGCKMPDYEEFADNPETRITPDINDQGRCYCCAATQVVRWLRCYV